MFIFAGGSPAQYQIPRSLRFNSADSANCTRTFGTPTIQNTFTFSVWVKRSAVASLQNIFGVSTNNSIGFPAADTLVVTLAGSATITTSGLYRDPAAWAHVLYRQTTGAAFLYWNGVQVGTSATVSAVFNTAVAHTLGAANASNYFNGYLSDVCFIDGLSLDPTSFGATNTITGAWEPKSLAGLTSGNNGFWLKFADNSSATTTDNTAGLGIDSLSTNWWTTTNFSVTAGVGNDSLVDTPTNYGTDTGAGGEVRGNFATLNSISPQFVGLNGNLDHNCNGAAESSHAIIPVPTTGKWRAEFTVSVGSNWEIHLHRNPNTRAGVADADTLFSLRQDDFFAANCTATTDSYSSASNNDVFSVLVDSDAGTFSIYQNGTLKVAAGTFAISGPFFFGCDRYTAVAGIVSCNFGQRAWAYSNTALSVSGFKALCTQNLPTPAIAKSSQYFDVNTRTGTGAAFDVIGKSFQPDLVWIKGRSGATDHAIYDAVRGVQQDIGSNLATDETTQAQGVTAFNSDGFSGGTLAKLNTSAATYVDWLWKESVTAGTDIVSYTGNGANRTIAHDLGVAPSMMIVKSRTTAGADTDWAVWHSGIANTEFLKLNTTAAKATGATYWNSTSPTSSVFSLGTHADVNTNSDTYINYLFVEVAGFSKFGTYTGNAAADGPFVWCGFRPRYVMIKSSTATDDWTIYDSTRDAYNVMPDRLYADTAGAEGTTSGLDFLSNGFKLRTITTTPNAAQTYIFAAFAESPFKTARAR